MFLSVLQAVMDVLVVILFLVCIWAASRTYREEMTEISLVAGIIIALVAIYGVLPMGLHFYHLFW